MQTNSVAASTSPVATPKQTPVAKPAAAVTPVASAKPDAPQAAAANPPTARVNEVGHT
ncbi:MAG: hypothetical protein HYZ45_10215, partial [Burkholderiales bacterium]|nr:hypothetical protein [Burkholderiales bacterium]